MRRFGRVGLLAVAPALGALIASTPAGAATPIPVVAPGHAFAVEVGGFAGRAAVRVQLVDSTAGRESVRADRHGRVHLSYRVPTSTGRYRLLVVGSPRTQPVRVTPAPAPPSAGDAQVVVVSVPLVIGVPFRVGEVGGSGGAGVGSGGLHAGGPSGSGGLAGTGVDLRTPLVLAAAFLLLGLVATRCGRRRAHP